ncbi:MAG: ABC transporter ATP-binding protein [Anaerolineales bacterium]|nr:ABC transporter ATP-binding protein [Anaerolineales bacterium]
MDKILSLENIHFRYYPDDPNVLSNLSLDIPAGKVTAILGPNGTGKTTLLHIMLGLLKPINGTVKVSGKSHKEYSRREMSQMIGLVPQFENIPFNFTVFEYVLLGRSPYLKPLQLPGAEDVRITEESLLAAGIEHLTNKPVNEISGGERQLVHISRVLTQQTRVLLLDEPTAHLDLENQNRILRLLKQMSSRGNTAVLTTHDPNAAIFAADYFVLMNRGKIIAQGNLDEVITAQNLSTIYRIPIRVEQTSGYTMVVMDKH